MDDTRSAPDHRALFAVASTQHGHFTAGQARACGFSTDLVAHHSHTGRFTRVARRVYRLRDYPTAPYDDVVAAWLAAGRDAVVSHESALALFDLSDVIPDAIHLTIPRRRRFLPAPPGVRLHTVTKNLQPDETVEREGFTVTSPTRTIVDVADAGVAPEQVELAIRQALQRALVTPSQLRVQSAPRGKRVATLVVDALERAAA